MDPEKKEIPIWKPPIFGGLTEGMFCRGSSYTKPHTSVTGSPGGCAGEQLRCEKLHRPYCADCGWGTTGKTLVFKKKIGSQELLKLLDLFLLLWKK